MNKNKLINLNRIFIILGLIGLIIVIVVNRSQLNSFKNLFHQINPLVIIPLVAIQILSYFMNGYYYQSILKILGYQVKVKKLFEGALATNYLNYILPSLGLAGATFLSQVLKNDVPRGVGVLTQLTRYAFSALAILIMFPVGIFLLINQKSFNHHLIKSLVLSVIILLVIIILIVSSINQEKFLKKYIFKFSNRFKAKASIKKFVNEFYSSFHLIIHAKQEIIKPTIISLIYINIEILTFYLAFLAFGQSENFGKLIIAYIAANIASLLGGVLFSTGIFEAGMTATLVLLSTPFSLALSVTIFYRVINLIIGLPPGFYYYQKYLK